MKFLMPGLTKFTAVSVLVLSLTACGGAEERKVKYLEKGKVYFAEKNYDKAKIEFKNVLQIDPKFAEAYYFMGQLDEKKKELIKAIGNYKKALELDPSHTNSKIKLAKIFVIAGTDDYINEAKKYLKQVESEQPGKTEAQLISATIEYKTGSKEKAIKEIEALVEKNSDLVEGISLLATIYLANGNDSKAIDLLKNGVKNNPENILLLISLSKTLTKNNDYKDSEIALKKVVSLEPENHSFQILLSSFYVTSGQLDKAEMVLRKSIEQDDEDAKRYFILFEMLASKVSLKKAEEEIKAAIKNKPDLYELKFSQVKFNERLGKRDEAKSILNKIIEDKDYDVEGIKARNMLARLLLEEGNEDAAKIHVDKVLAEHPADDDALLMISKISLSNLDAITAINNLRTVIKNNPKSSEASFLLAKAYELNGESQLSENELKKSIERNPINDQVHVNYASYLASKGRIEESMSVVDKALTYFKDSYDLMDVKLKILASQGKNSEALMLLNVMEQANPDNADVNFTKGKYYLSQKDMPKAIDEFEKSYVKSSNKFKPLEMIVKSYLSMGQADKALERLQVQLNENEDDAVANLLTGQVYLVQNKFADAKVKFQKASKVAENWLPPYTSLASTYIAEKNIDEAIKVYKDAISKLSNKVPAQLQLASIYERKKDIPNAMQVYEDLLVENSGNKLAANNYAALLLDYGKESDVNKALSLLKGFDKLKQPALIDTLGWANVKSGNSQKAVELLKPVVQSSPETAVFRYHLGFALYEIGDKAAAKSHLDVAVSSEQQFFGKEHAAELLKTM